jgi:hypothetical protein
MYARKKQRQNLFAATGCDGAASGNILLRRQDHDCIKQFPRINAARQARKTG